MKKFLILLFILISFHKLLLSQVPRETRAVWVTTNFQLDWPPKTFNQEEQKQSLEDIFINLKKKNFNTVYFQVRSNGTVMYKSEIEPFSPYFTGDVNVLPNYDPLEYTIKLGKKYNLEIHAWVNMIRCFSGSDDRFLQSPLHIRNKYPQYTVMSISENGGVSYWINPAIPEAQDYLVNILLEISSKYDVDGIHLDCFRYPGNNFDDDKYYNKLGLTIPKDDWRRNNLSTILRKFNEQKNPLNPFLKLGATPIGIRKSLNGASGWEGYSSVYQDTETWLQEGLVDYLTPQIYWDFDKNPKFDVLADDWVKKSHNRNIVLGLAAYKSDVLPQLDRMIEFSREIGASGISFFRYENIANLDFTFFEDLAFPSNMPWKEIGNPNHSKKINLTYEYLSKNEVMLSWENKIQESNLFRIRSLALFNTTGTKTSTKFIGTNKNKVKLKFAKPSKLSYSYRIGEISRLWNIINLSYQISVKVPYLEDLKNSSLINMSPILYKHNSSSGFLSITSSLNQKATLDIFTIENTGYQKIIELKFGENIFRLKDNFKLIKSIRIAYNKTGKTDELNFIN